jgi:hypothetical protein
METDVQLLAEFVECFTKYDEGKVFARPTNPALLHSIEARLPAPLPPLFGQLLTNYRWSDIYVDRLKLLSNPPGLGFDGFAAELFQDPELIDILLPGGFVQFARPLDGRTYDPICFDTNRMQADGDCPVVRIDHEDALVLSKLTTIEQLAPSFRDLVLIIISAVES